MALQFSTSYTVSATFPPTASNGPIGPFLIPPSNANVDYTQPLAIWVGAVCAANTSAQTPGVAASTNQPAFSLVFAPSQVPQNTSFFAKVSIAPNFVYSADPAIRAQLAGYFTLFKQQVEALEVPQAGSPTGGLIPGGARLLLNRVATNMPLRFDEVLTYLYAFNASSQYVDLSPGMSLRLEWAGYQYCDGPGGAGYGLNSYVNSGSSRFVITQQPDFTLATDAFLAQLVPGYGVNPPTACPQIAAGLLDLEITGNARRHLRLIYPTTFVGAGSVDNGGSSGQTSARLIGADTYADLEAATADVLAGNTGCGKASQGNKPIVSIAFNGRVAVIPEISFFYDGVTTVVPIGTTLRNVIQQVADPAPSQFFNNQTSNMYVRMRRWTQMSGTPLSIGANTYLQALFDFGSAPATAGPLLDCFDIPLAKGDAVTLPNIENNT